MPRLVDSLDLIVFDLDGTLAETRRDIARSVNHALVSVGRPEIPLASVVEYVGDGARRLVERALGDAATDARVSHALSAFMAHYEAHCLVDTALYPGTAETLLRLRPKPLAVLTNKPSSPTHRILESCGIGSLLAAVVGGDDAPAKKPDPRGLLGIVRDLGVRPQSTLLVGDTAVDVETARRASTLVAGVRFGFRPQDFASAPPDYILSNLAELLDLEV